MKKLITTILSLLFFLSITRAQITGSTTVCAGYVYTYSVNIPGAITYVWFVPNGWYDLIGQGTSQITITCNVNPGVVSVEGYGSTGLSVGLHGLNTQFSAGSGWNVGPNQITDCANQTVSQPIFAMPNGTGGGAACPSGCGTGIQHANIDYVIYDNPWPVGNFISLMSGTFLMPAVPSTYYVYKVDYTNGFIQGLQAILIDGGCGTATVNNTIQFSPTFPLPINFSQSPSPVCVGDTVSLTANNMATFLWTAQPGATLLNNGVSPVNVVVDSIYSAIDVTGLDMMGCLNGSSYPILTSNCPPTGIVDGTSTADEIFAYPNPAHDFVTIKTNLKSPVELEIFNSLGKEVFEKKSFSNQINVAVKNFANGIYTIKAGNVFRSFVKL